MLFNILPYVLVLAICVKIPMTRRLIMKYPIISKIGLMLLNFIKDIVFSNERMQGKTQYPNNLTGFSSETSNHIRDAERFTSPRNAHVPGNIYHYYYYDKQ